MQLSELTAALEDRSTQLSQLQAEFDRQLAEQQAKLHHQQLQAEKERAELHATVTDLRLQLEQLAREGPGGSAARPPTPPVAEAAAAAAKPARKSTTSELEPSPAATSPRDDHWQDLHDQLVRTASRLSQLELDYRESRDTAAVEAGKLAPVSRHGPRAR
jgi:cell division protein FtsB